MDTPAGLHALFALVLLLLPSVYVTHIWYVTQISGCGIEAYHEGLGHCLGLPHPPIGHPLCGTCFVQYHRVPKFWTHGSVCCACAQRPGLPCAWYSG